MSTLENFQLGEVPATPSNHRDCDARPVQVDLRYRLSLATPLLRSVAGAILFVDRCLKGYLHGADIGCGLST